SNEIEAGSDLFSLGGVIYTMLTGKHPFSADSVPALMHQICDDEPVPIAELRAEVPRGVGNVVAIAMAKRRDQRYATASELAADLRAALDGTLELELEARVQKLERGKTIVRRSSREVMSLGKTQQA